MSNIGLEETIGAKLVKGSAWNTGTGAPFPADPEQEVRHLSSRGDSQLRGILLLSPHYLFDGKVNRGVAVSTAAIAEALKNIYGNTALVAELEAK